MLTVSDHINQPTAALHLRAIFMRDAAIGQQHINVEKKIYDRERQTNRQTDTRLLLYTYCCGRGQPTQLSSTLIYGRRRLTNQCPQLLASQDTIKPSILDVVSISTVFGQFLAKHLFFFNNN